jgi:hypothetical protein
MSMALVTDAIDMVLMSMTGGTHVNDIGTHVDDMGTYV